MTEIGNPDIDTAEYRDYLILMTTTNYIEINEDQIPAGVRFDVPARNQGQIVEIAYGGYDRAEHDEGDPYQRVIDKSEPVGTAARVRYFRRA